MGKIITYLKENNIAFAVLKGVHDKDSYQMDTKEFKVDLDIVLDCKRNSFINALKTHPSFTYLEQNSFLDIENNLRIDCYFNTLNVGYYHYLKIKKHSFLNNKVSENEYIVYQILDPLLKFSKYHFRHQYRLSAYFKLDISFEIKVMLKDIIGKKLGNQLVDNIANGNYDVSSTFIKKSKFRMLFINGNFVKMLQSRLN